MHLTFGWGNSFTVVPVYRQMGISLVCSCFSGVAHCEFTGAVGYHSAAAEPGGDWGRGERKRSMGCGGEILKHTPVNSHYWGPASTVSPPTSMFFSFSTIIIIILLLYTLSWMVTHFFFRYESLLQEPDPIPVYALKLLGSLTEHSNAINRYACSTATLHWHMH